MVPRSFKIWLVPLVFTSISLSLNVAKAAAQTIYPFAATYRTTVSIKPISGNVSQVFEVGVSDDAPYNLGVYEGLTYSVIDANSNLTFNNNPQAFGVEGFPSGYIVFGNSTNKLLGTSDASASVNFDNLTARGSGIVNITGGEGIFKNATSTLLFSEEDTVNLGAIITLNGLASVNGSIKVAQVVPEPNTMTPLVGIGLTVFALFSLRGYRRVAH